MEKILKAMSSKLKIRSKPLNDYYDMDNMNQFDYSYKETSDSVKELFIKELTNYTISHLSNCPIGTKIEYTFNYKRSVHANNNLLEVLDKLPKLPEGEEYCFSINTYLAFVFQGNSSNFLKLKPLTSSWISKIVKK